ncbi:hypothetical protein IWZ00DRAFT_545749 [Phyllosticta capitalensis]
MTTTSTTRPPMPYNLIQNRSIVAQDIDGDDGAWCPCSLSVVFKPRVSQGMMHLRLKADFMNLNHDEYVYLRLPPEKLVAMEFSDDGAAIPFEIQQHLDDRTPGHMRRGEYLVVTLTLKAPGSVLVPLDFTKLTPSLRSVPQVRAYHSLCRASKLRLFVRKHGLSEAHRDTLQLFASLAAAGTLLPVPLDSSRINGARGVSEVDAGVFDFVTPTPSAKADSPPPYSAQHAATGSKRRHNNDDDDNNNERGSASNELQLDFVPAGTPSAPKRTREVDAASPPRSARGSPRAPASGGGSEGEQQPAFPTAGLTTTAPETLLNALTPLLTLLTSLPNAATDIQAQIRATTADAMQELRLEADQCLQEMHEEELHALARLRGECHAHWETHRGERQPSRTPTDLRWRTSESSLSQSSSSSLRARRLRARARALGVPLSTSSPRRPSAGGRGELTSTESDTPVVDSPSTPPLRGGSPADPRPMRSAATRNLTPSLVEARTPEPRATESCPRTLHFYFSPLNRQGLSQSPTQADTLTPTPTPETTARTTSIAALNAPEPQAAAAAPANIAEAGKQQEAVQRRGFVLLKEDVGRAQQLLRERRGVSV